MPVRRAPASRSPVDHALFSQVGLDSGALGRLGTVVHRFDEQGAYRVATMARGVAVDETTLRVEQGAPDSVHVDLADAGRRGSASGDGVAVAPGGHVLFHVGSGNLRWAVEATDDPSGGPKFDSRRLERGDQFVATILRPGSYAVANTLGSGETEIHVPFVAPGRTPYRPGPPMYVAMGPRCSEASLQLGAAQPLVFEIEQAARIVVQLTGADDGPS